MPLVLYWSQSIHSVLTIYCCCVMESVIDGFDWSPRSQAISLFPSASVCFGKAASLTPSVSARGTTGSPTHTSFVSLITNLVSKYTTVTVSPPAFLTHRHQQTCVQRCWWIGVKFQHHPYLSSWSFLRSGIAQWEIRCALSDGVGELVRDRRVYVFSYLRFFSESLEWRPN